MNYITTTYGENIPEGAFQDYIERLTGRFFKILPLREENYETLDVYLERFRKELISSKQLFNCLENDSRYITLIVTIESLKSESCTLEETKNLVFNAMNTCKSIAKDYGGDKNECDK